MAHDNVALVRRWFEEVWNLRREEVIDELLTAESICHGEGGLSRGPEEFKERQYVPFIAGFPGLRVEVESAVAQGDEVVVRWIASGCHSGDGLVREAARETASFRGITWVRVSDGKLVEGWQSSNIPEVVRGLAAPAPA